MSLISINVVTSETELCYGKGVVDVQNNKGFSLITYVSRGMADVKPFNNSIAYYKFMATSRY